MISWEKPIEQIILEHVTYMENQWEAAVNDSTGFFERGFRHGAENRKEAYGSIKKYIEGEIKIRNMTKFKKGRK